MYIHVYESLYAYHMYIHITLSKSSNSLSTREHTQFVPSHAPFTRAFLSAHISDSTLHIHG